MRKGSSPSRSRRAPEGFYLPEERLYQLKGLLYRNLRVRIDTGLHTGKLGFDDAVTLFSEVVDFLPGSCSDAKVLKQPAKKASCASAQAAVNRYSRWPTQAITYRIGKDQIVALRTRARQELGDKFSEQRFHLEFMKQGTIAAGYFGDELIGVLKAGQLSARRAVAGRSRSKVQGPSGVNRRGPAGGAPCGA